MQLYIKLSLLPIQSCILTTYNVNIRRQYLCGLYSLYVMCVNRIVLISFNNITALCPNSECVCPVLSSLLPVSSIVVSLPHLAGMQSYEWNNLQYGVKLQSINQSYSR